MAPARYSTAAVLAALALVLVLAGGWCAEAGTKDECGLAQTAFGDCTAYVSGAEDKVSPRCCAGLADVRDLAPTAALRRAVCACILSEMLAAGKINSGRAAGLPAACNVGIRFIPTSPVFDCSQIS